MGRKASFYARCGDDILIGAKSRTAIERLADMTEHIMKEKKLSLNRKKTMILEPGETFLFLGWKISGREIDFSDEALLKIGKSIRKKTRNYLIQVEKAGIPQAFRLPLLIRQIDRSIRANRITKSFSIVTVPDGLKKIDHMICDGIRTVVTGKTGKGKYALTYQTIRSWGYRSLVNRYFRQLS